jgi:UDP-glucose 4-epimerase
MADLKEKKVLVTGGAGFIGYHLCSKLSNLTDDLTIYDDLSSGKMENVKDVPKAKFFKGDILDLKTLYGLEKSDLIYHLAAQVVFPILWRTH